MKPTATSVLWFWYLAGAVSMLAYKAYRYYRIEKKNSPSKDLKMIMGEWFFEKSAENSISWVATIGIVWCFGVMLVNRVEFVWFEAINRIPAHIAFAFLLGSLMEYAAPNAAKWVLSKLPGGT